MLIIARFSISLPDMIDKNELKQSAYTIALLVILIMGLLIASVISGLRGKLKLSAAYSLSWAGISVSLPEGGYWQHSKNWQYFDNSFILQAQHQSAHRDSTNVEVTLDLAAVARTPEQGIEALAAAMDAKVVKTGRLDNTDPAFSYAKLDTSKQNENFYAAYAVLPYNRGVSVIIRTTRYDDEAIEILEGVAGSFEFNDSEAQKAGQQFAEEVKRFGTDDMLEDGGKTAIERAYLITGLDDKPVGLSIQSVSHSADSDAQPIRVEQLYFIRSRTSKVLVKDIFHCDSYLDTFLWQSSHKNSSTPGQEIFGLTLKEDGLLKVIDSRVDADSTIKPSSLAVPDIILDHAARYIPDINKGNVSFEVILSAGLVLPINTSIVENPPSFEALETPAETVIMLELTHDTDKYQLLYLDRDGNIVGKVDKTTNRTLLWTKTDKQELSKHFPELLN